MNNSVGMGHKVVTVRALCKDFRRPNGSFHSVLEGVQFDVAHNEFVSILGISGSGKSTLMRCISNFVSPDRGQVTFAPVPKVHGQAFSYVFQRPALFPWLTVSENIGVALQNCSRRQRLERVDDILEFMGLRSVEDSYPRELGAATCQRVNMARALVSRPMLLLMDEPFSALDALTAQSLRAEIARYWMQNERPISSAIFVTNSIEEAIQLSDRIILLTSKPGTVYKILNVPLPRPRNPADPKYEEFKTLVETTFSEMYLHEHRGAIAEEEQPAPLPTGLGGTFPYTVPAPIETRSKRPRPLVKVNPTAADGLLTRLLEETEPMDIYDLAGELGESMDKVMPAVQAAELLGFLTTMGSDIALSAAGRDYASERDPLLHRNMFRDACMRMVLINTIVEQVKKQGDDGVEKSQALEMILTMLPLEDYDQQFDALLKWTQHADLLRYDTDSETLYYAGD